MSMSQMNPTGRMTAWLEQAWMERYLDRQLGEDELEWFEAYLLDKPHLLDRWSTDLALRDGVDLLNQRGGASEATPALQELQAPPPPATVRPVPHVRVSAARRRQWHLTALAASVAIAFGSGFLLNGAVRPGHDDLLIPDPTRVVIDSSRGGGQQDNVENAGSASEFVLVDALVPPDATYVAVRGPGMPERKLNVSKDGVATLLLRRSEIGRMGPLSLLIKAGGREFEKPLPLKQLESGDHP
jgi:hypothetical protein